jgi:cell division protein FtsW
MKTYLSNSLLDLQRFDRHLQLLLVALIALGFIAMTSASIEHAASRYGDMFFFAKRYFFHFSLAFVVSVLMYLTPVDVWERTGWLWLLFGFLLLALVLIPGVGREVNGSRRWLALGPLTLQASEFVKLCVIFYLAGYLVRRRDEVRQSWSGFIKPMALLFAVTLLLMLEPDFGATVVTAGTAFVMIFLGGVKLGQFLLVILSCVAGAVAMVIFEPYRMKRLTAFTDPWADQFNTGYQLTQSLIAFGRGQVSGVGLGNSVQKLFARGTHRFCICDFCRGIWLLGQHLDIGIVCRPDWPNFVYRPHCRSGGKTVSRLCRLWHRGNDQRSGVYQYGCEHRFITNQRIDTAVFQLRRQ